MVLITSQSAARQTVLKTAQVLSASGVPPRPRQRPTFVLCFQALCVHSWCSNLQTRHQGSAQISILQQASGGVQTAGVRWEVSGIQPKSQELQGVSPPSFPPSLSLNAASPIRRDALLSSPSLNLTPSLLPKVLEKQYQEENNNAIVERFCNIEVWGKVKILWNYYFTEPYSNPSS